MKNGKVKVKPDRDTAWDFRANASPVPSEY